MNFYDILNIPNTASKSDIKKAYHKLVMHYHPDKCTEPNSKEKFQEIQTAYEILYNDDKRKVYDGMSIEQRSQIFDLIKEYFTDIKPQYSYIYNSIIDFLYSNKEDDFKNDINSFNIKKIFSRIIDKIKNDKIISDKIIKNSNKNIIEIHDTIYDLIIPLKDKYDVLFKYARVIKENNEYTEYIIPICEDEFIINDPDKGIIKINIICEDNKNYKIIDKYNLLHIKKISLHQYIYGGKVKIYNINGEIIWFEFESCLEKKPIFIIDNKGLPKINSDNEIINRGDLVIYFNIEGINSINEDDISQTYSKVVEDTIKLMFPPID